jgi:hypothetical protein
MMKDIQYQIRQRRQLPLNLLTDDGFWVIFLSVVRLCNGLGSVPPEVTLFSGISGVSSGVVCTYVQKGCLVSPEVKGR